MRWGLLGLILLATPAWGADPVTYPESGVQVFLGLDDTSAPTNVQDGRAQDLQNVVLDVSKSLRQRYGVKVIGNSLDIASQDFCDVTGLFYTKFSSATERIIATCDERFYYLNGSTWTQVAGATITAGQNNQFVFTVALDNIVGTNGVNAPVRYDSTTFTTVSFSGLTNAIQKAKTVAFFKNYLIFCNTTEAGTAYPTRFRWSNVGTIGTWSDADYVDIGALGGQEINAIAELYDNLYVFLTDSIYKISLVGGADTFQVSKVTDDIGCIAKNSVQSITLTNAQSGLVFLDKDKRVYFFNGIIAQDITQLITVNMNGLGASRLPYAVSADTGTDYILCATNGTGATNDLCLDFQYQIGEWTKHTNIAANAMAGVVDNNVLDQVYYGTHNALVYQLEDSSLRDDVGSATGTVGEVGTYSSSTASGLTVLYTSSANYTTGALVGAPIELIGGTGATQTNTVIDNTLTGLVVVSAFTTTPDSTTTFEVGAIDSFYTSKWYDMGQSARLKHFGEVYLWADADVTSTHTLSYATDFDADISTVSVSLSDSTSDAIWGTAIWGTSLWGGSQGTVFRPAKVSGQGRYFRVKWTEDDPGETFHMYGWIPVYWWGSVN